MNKIGDLFKSKEEIEFERLLEELGKMEPDSSEYKSMFSIMERLANIIQERRKERSIKPEVWVPAVTSIASILLVLNYEKLGVITGKAFNMIKFK